MENEYLSWIHKHPKGKFNYNAFQHVTRTLLFAEHWHELKCAIKKIGQVKATESESLKAVKVLSERKCSEVLQEVFDITEGPFADPVISESLYERMEEALDSRHNDGHMNQKLFEALYRVFGVTALNDEMAEIINAIKED